MNESVRVVFMTAPDEATGRELARRLVEERLAACGNVLPGLVSLFRWEGEIQEEEEVLVMLKAPGSGIPALLARARELHPYDVPELLALPVLEGSPAYLQWVLSSCGVGDGVRS